jgi:predicted ATPase
LSQALPLAAYDARLNRGYFVAYQPEVHLHPFAQSRLADIFVKSVARGNQLFIETHSPDLILRLQAKVTKGEIAPDQVRIFCIENNKGRSTIAPVNLTVTGAPSIPWPPGFLDTSLSLARDLVSQRISKS